MWLDLFLVKPPLVSFAARSRRGDFFCPTKLLKSLALTLTVTDTARLRCRTHPPIALSQNSLCTTFTLYQCHCHQDHCQFLKYLRRIAKSIATALSVSILSPCWVGGFTYFSPPSPFPPPQKKMMTWMWLGPLRQNRAAALQSNFNIIFIIRPPHNVYSSQGMLLFDILHVFLYLLVVMLLYFGCPFLISSFADTPFLSFISCFPFFFLFPPPS